MSECFRLHTVLNSKINHYVNQIQFSDIRILETEDLENDLNDLYDTYLYYDKKKPNRINHNRVRALASKIVASSVFKNSVKKCQNKSTFYDSAYDFSIELGREESYVKAFSLD